MEESRPTVDGVGYVFLALLVPSVFMLIAAVGYYERRHVFPISMRKPILSLTGALGILCYCIYACIVWGISNLVSAFTNDLIYSFLLLTTAAIYLWRAWLLYFLSLLAAENTKRVLSNDQDEAFTTFFHRSRYLIRTRNVLMCVFLCSVPSLR
jgi:hypothetical protein